MKKKLAIGTSALLMLSVLFGSSFTTSAKEVAKDPHKTDKKVLKELKPEKGSQVILKTAEIVLIDGIEYVEASGHGEANAPAEGFDIVINKETGTYKTTKLSKDKMQLKKDPEQKPNGDVSMMTVYPTYTKHVVIDTYDPPNYHLTQSNLGLSWQVDPTVNQTVPYDRSIYAWGANPSEAQTHGTLSTLDIIRLVL